MGKRSIKRNYLYNLLYQIFALLTPLVVTPYISRVLGSAGIGQYSFTYSISTYFVLVAAFGFGYYAQREIARAQGDKHQQSVVFFEIIIARSASVFISLFIYVLLLFTGVYEKVYEPLMWIMAINVISPLFDVAFVFQGNEEFGIIAIRNIIIRVLGVALVLIFVKNESHVWLYALCQSLILIVSNLSLWPNLRKVITRVPFRELRIKRHFCPTLRLFIPTVAISVYTMFDKTLIGLLVPGETSVDGVEKKISDIENGYYDQAEKLVKMAMTVLTSLGTVMIPRNSQAIAAGDLDQFKSNINKAIRFVFFLGVPLLFGIAAVSFNFSPWFFGNGYEKVPYLMMVLSPLVLIIGLSNVLGIQYLLPQKEDKKYTIAIVSGALLNLALNLVFIPFFWSYGACIATIIAELLVTSLMFVFARKDISFFKTVFSSWMYILSGAMMFLSVFFTQRFLTSSVTHTLLLIAEGVVIYIGLLFALRDKLLLGYTRQLWRRVSGKKEQ